MTKILLIDDDVELCELVSRYLVKESYAVEAIHRGNDGLKRALSGEYALIVLDLMLPGMDGLEVLRRIRAESQMPVIILTARGDDVDRIVGLEVGADDYLPKPFNPRELVARIRAILRRAHTSSGSPGIPDRVVVGDVELDAGAQTVRRSGAPIELTSVEFGILDVLMRAAGHVVTRDQLAQMVLGRRFMAYDRSVDMHVSKVRRKLGDKPDGSERIKAIRGIGYIYATPEEEVRR